MSRQRVMSLTPIAAPRAADAMLLGIACFACLGFGYSVFDEPGGVNGLLA